MEVGHSSEKAMKTCSMWSGRRDQYQSDNCDTNDKTKPFKPNYINGAANFVSRSAVPIHKFNPRKSTTRTPVTFIGEYPSLGFSSWQAHLIITHARKGVGFVFSAWVAK